MAVAACVLWLTSVEGMPAFHEAMHGRLAPHRHDLGSIVTVSFEDTTHRHPDGSIHYVSPKPRPARRALPDGRSHVTGGAAHADGLAHHAAALAPPPPPITKPFPIDRRPSAMVAQHSVKLVARDPLAATARGPPIPA